MNVFLNGLAVVAGFALAWRLTQDPWPRRYIRQGIREFEELLCRSGGCE